MISTFEPSASLVLAWTDDFDVRGSAARKTRHRAAGRKDLSGTNDMEFQRSAFHEVRTDVPAQTAGRCALGNPQPAHLARLVCGPLGRRDGHGFVLAGAKKIQGQLAVLHLVDQLHQVVKAGQRLVVALEQDVVLLNARLGRRTLRLQGLDKQALVLGQLQLGLQGGRRTRREHAQPVFAPRSVKTSVGACVGQRRLPRASASPSQRRSSSARHPRGRRGRQQGRRGSRRT